MSDLDLNDSNREFSNFYQCSNKHFCVKWAKQCKVCGERMPGADFVPPKPPSEPVKRGRGRPKKEPGS